MASRAGLQLVAFVGPTSPEPFGAQRVVRVDHRCLDLPPKGENCPTHLSGFSSKTLLRRLSLGTSYQRPVVAVFSLRNAGFATNFAPSQR